MAKIEERHIKMAEQWFPVGRGTPGANNMREAYAQALADAEARIVADLREAADDVCPDPEVGDVISLAERSILLTFAERYEHGGHYD